MKKIFLFITIVLIVLSLITIILSPKTYATNFTEMNYGWSNRPITVYAADNLTVMEIGQLKEAIAAWNSTKFGTFFTYGGTLPTKSIISLAGINGVIKDSFSSESEVGANTLTKGNGTTRTKFVTTLNTNTPFNTTSGSRFYLKSILMHEFGHALGLKHSIFSNSFMYEYSNGVTTFLQSDLESIDRYY